MTVTLELKPEVEARVVEQAASRGVPVEDFLEVCYRREFEGRGRPGSPAILVLLEVAVRLRRCNSRTSWPTPRRSA